MPAVHGKGPAPARIMIVGEAPGAEEELRGMPFVGASGMFLDEQLAAVGLSRSECFLTNVARTRPPGNDIKNFFVNHKKRIPGLEIAAGIAELEKEVTRVQPNLIIAMGDTAAWAIAADSPVGILKWRGSILAAKPSFGGCKVIPTVHPAYILRQYEDRPLFLADLARARREAASPHITVPDRDFRIAPRLGDALEWIDRAIAQGLYSCDIETLGGSITCVGIGLSRKEVMCIPFIDPRRVDACYWTLEEETLIWRALRRLFASPAQLIGQNFAYDAFYFIMKMGIRPRIRWDLMVMHHTLFPLMKKSLAFISSMYCEYYRYWKDDGKLWGPRKVSPEQLWNYNCEDLSYNWEAYEIVRAMLDSQSLMPQYDFLIEEVWQFARDMEVRGLRVNRELKSRLGIELLEFQMNTMREIEYVLGHPLNPRSSPQMQALFYGDFGEKPILNRKTWMPTLDDGALEAIAQRSPHLRRLVQRIQDYRSAGVLHSSYAEMPLDTDGRARCSFNITGAATFRFSSSANPFGSGGNLQTITKGEEDEEHEPGRLTKPNMRLMFEPDPGYTWIDFDLQRADLMVVAWEADDDELREQLLAGYNPYKVAASEYLKVPFEEVPHRRYTDFKSFFHGSNYTGKPPTMARNCNMLVHEAELLQRWWFGKHPGIPRWHRRLETDLRARRTIRNAFGFRNVYFGRIEGVLSEAAAWGPQSTVAITVNHAISNIRRTVPEAELLLQVHDSGDVQVRTDLLPRVLPKLRRATRVVVPYAKPLVIGVGASISSRSWGDVEEIKPSHALWKCWASDELPSPDERLQLEAKSATLIAAK